MRGHILNLIERKHVQTASLTFFSKNENIKRLKFFINVDGYLVKICIAIFIACLYKISEIFGGLFFAKSEKKFCCKK